MAALFYTPFRQLLSNEMGSSQILLKMNTIFRRAEQEDDLGAIIARIYDICS